MKRVELVLTALVTLAALVVAGVALTRQFSGAQPASPGGNPAAVTLADNDWSDLLGASRQVSDSRASVRVVILSDFECPSCRAFHDLLSSLEDSLVGIVETRYAHYPLPYHRFALPTARMVECTAADADASRLIDVLFASQDSLGLLPWLTLAERAKLPDAPKVASCATDASGAEDFVRIKAGLELASRIGALGTPTVVVEGKRFPGVPTRDQLVAIIESVR